MTPLFLEPEEVKKTREKFRHFAAQYLLPNIEKDYKKSSLPPHYYQKLAQNKGLALLIPPQWKGLGLNAFHYYAMLEEIAYANPAFAITVAVTYLVIGAILEFGNQSQKNTLLPLLAEGKLIAAFSLSEPQAGSDAASLQLKVEKKKDSYILNGTKCWCSSAGQADLYLVMGRLQEKISAFLIPAQTPGFSIGKIEKKMGLHSSPLGELVFENAIIPKTSLLFQEGKGLQVALSQLDTGRIGIAAVALGLIRSLWDHLYQNPYPNLPLFKTELANLWAQMRAIRALLYQTIERKVKKLSYTEMASCVKLLASELAMQMAHTAANIAPSSLLSYSHPISRVFCDTKALQIVEGTNQIQQLIIQRNIKKHYSY